MNEKCSTFNLIYLYCLGTKNDKFETRCGGGANALMAKCIATIALQDKDAPRTCFEARAGSYHTALADAYTFINKLKKLILLWVSVALHI